MTARIVFIVLMAMSIYFVKLSIFGIPARALLSVLFLIVLIITDGKLVISGVRRYSGLISSIVILALTGTCMTLMSGGEMSSILQYLVEVHIQSVVNILIASTIVTKLGKEFPLKVFLVCFCVTSLFAVFQFFQVSPAWDARMQIARIQGDLIEASSYFLNLRPMGLSFNPVIFATQVCLALAATLVLYKNKYRNSTMVFIVLCLTFATLCVVSGNRSPLLGIAILIPMYLVKKRNYGVLAICALLMVMLAPALNDVGSTSQLRVSRVDDDSALGRMALFYYGFLLFVDNPLGHGFEFDSTAYWRDYWEYISSMPSAETIIYWPLHNYILNMLNVYGVAFVGIIVYAFIHAAPYRASLLLLTPYIIHILFHNDGPLWSDYLIWFLVPSLLSDGRHDVQVTKRADSVQNHSK